MKAMSGVLSLIAVLAVVVWLAKTQLHRPSAAVATPSTLAPDSGGVSLPPQAKALQQGTRDAAMKALQEGVQRNERSDPR